jgi:microcystin-dependent protein
MLFIPKNWKNHPSEDTPISAEALIDLEERLSDYVNAIMPAGHLIYSVVSDEPDGWLIANGQKVTTDYPVLRSALIGLGNPYGVDGSDPRLPNLVQKFARGNTTVGGTGGANTVTLTINEMPSHTHIQDPHTHGVIARSGSSAGSNTVLNGTTGSAAANITTNPTAANSATAVNQNTGGGQAHENRPPFVDVTPLVRAY